MPPIICSDCIIGASMRQKCAKKINEKKFTAKQYQHQLPSPSAAKSFEPPRGKTNNMVFKQVRHKPVRAVTETGLKLEISD